MDSTALFAISPLDGRYHEKINPLRPIFSEYGLIRFRVQVEIRWLQFLSQQAHLPELPALSKDASEFLENILENFSKEDAMVIKEWEEKINHDVKAVEYFLKERMQKNAELAKISEFIHFGCTSEDINNLSYALMLKNAREEIILPALDKLTDSLKKMAHDYADQPMLSRTHGQAATPTTLGKEIANVIARLERQLTQLLNTSIMGKLNGACGNYNAFLTAYPEIDWPLLNKQFVLSLDLEWNDYTTQIEPHDYMAELFSVLMRINTILIDFNRDMWGYISLNYFQQKSLSHEVGSSTMPHKINPIDFENAEGNLGVANSLFDHMSAKLPISRWQRDLSDTTVLRNMGVALAHSFLAYQSTCRGLNKVTSNPTAIHDDLNHHWEILAEPIQMVMRRHGIEQPYEKLKIFTRGKKITPELIQTFINELPLPDEIKKQLISLTPDSYIGYAAKLAKQI